MEYFGENVSAIPARPNCCDNCSQGMTAWSLADLYEDLDDGGFHDFATNTPTLLNAMKAIERGQATVEKTRLKNFLIGWTGKKNDEKLLSLRGNRLYGSGKAKGPNYWVALLQQLQQEDFIEMVPGTTTIKWSTKAEEWMARPWPKTLKFKAIGPMYEFFKKKRSTPLTTTATSLQYEIGSNGTSHTERIPWNKFKFERDILMKILEAVRMALSAQNEVEPTTVASDAALNRMVQEKPRNYDEFRYTPYDGFNVEKMHKYGPTFVNAIEKYVVN